MDDDVALRFVLSGLSMSRVKIEEAFAFACKEMQYREEDRAIELAKNTPVTSKPSVRNLEAGSKSTVSAAKELAKAIDNLFSSSKKSKK